MLTASSNLLQVVYTVEIHCRIHAVIISPVSCCRNRHRYNNTTMWHAVVHRRHRSTCGVRTNRCEQLCLDTFLETVHHAQDATSVSFPHFCVTPAHTRRSLSILLSDVEKCTLCKMSLKKRERRDLCPPGNFGHMAARAGVQRSQTWGFLNYVWTLIPEKLFRTCVLTNGSPKPVSYTKGEPTCFFLENEKNSLSMDLQRHHADDSARFVLFVRRQPPVHRVKSSLTVTV